MGRDKKEDTREKSGLNKKTGEKRELGYWNERYSTKSLRDCISTSVDDNPHNRWVYASPPFLKDYNDNRDKCSISPVRHSRSCSQLTNHSF